MALSPSSALVISTKANPRDRPVSLSVIMLTLSICPYGSNAWRSSSSVVWKSKFPTKMFFTRSPRGYEIGLSVGGFGERKSSPRRGRSCGQSNEEASIAGPLRTGRTFSKRAPERVLIVNSLPRSSIRRRNRSAWRGNAGRASSRSGDSAGAARMALAGDRYPRPQCCGRRNRERETLADVLLPSRNPISDLPQAWP